MSEPSVIEQFARMVGARFPDVSIAKVTEFICDFLGKVLLRLEMLPIRCDTEAQEYLLQCIQETFSERLIDYIATGLEDGPEAQALAEELVEAVCQYCRDNIEVMETLSKMVAKTLTREAVKFGVKQTAKEGVKQVAKQGVKQVANQAAKQAAKQVGKQAARQAAKQAVRRGAGQGAKQIAKQAARQAAKQGATQGAKYTAKVMTAAVNPLGIVPDLAQAGLELTGYEKTGRAVGVGGNVAIGAAAGALVGGPPGAVIGAAVAGGVWAFGEAAGAAVNWLWSKAEEPTH